MKRDEWLGEFAKGLGLQPPSSEEVRRLLELAGVAAHASERTAAPIACWLAGRAERRLDELTEHAKSISQSSEDD